MNTTKQNIIGRIVAIFLVVGMAFTSIPAPAYAIIYAPGATLNPSCLPTDVNCSVSTPNAGGTLFAPSDVSVTPQGATGSTVYSYRVSIVDSSNGETVPSIATTTTAGNATLSATDYNAISWSAVSGAAHYNVYGRTSGSDLFIASTTATSYLDTGSITPSGAAPTTNTTGALSGNTLSITADGTFGGALTVTGNTTLSNALTLSALAGGILQTNVSGTVSTTSLASLTSNTLSWLGNTLTSTVNGVATTTNISYADATTDGIVSTTTQTFAGDKTFSGALNASSTLMVTGNSTLYGTLAVNSAATLATTTVSKLTLSGLTGLVSADTSGLLSGIATSTLGIALSDTTGILEVTRGGTGTSTAPATGQLLLGNASGGYDLVATSSLGISGGSSLTGTTGQTLYFSGTDTPTATSTLFISGGNVGIGSINPNNKLTVAGTFGVSTETAVAANPNLNSGNGTVTTVGADTVITYTTTGASSFTPPTGVSNVRVLVVGGGGAGGGSHNGGGGGAGGVSTSTSVAVSGAMTVTVGAGGVGNTTDSGVSTSGGNSAFAEITATGGGFGASGNDSTSAGNGGSGGGASGFYLGSTAGTGADGQGNVGGAQGPGGSWTSGGGGGGAGSVGAAGVTATTGGDGGIGIQNDITGVNTYYGGGGGGAGSGVGGLGGGGTAGGAAASTPGTNGLGGGGGGGNASPPRLGGNGGSGTVIIRFATVAATAVPNQALLRVTNTGTDASSTIAFFETGANQSCIIAGETGLTCSSDENLKKDIARADGSLSSVLLLKPVTYNWRSAEDTDEGFDPYAVTDGVTGGNIGFIAQDIEKVFPGLNLVRKDPNGNLTLAYDKLSAVIVSALQEQYGGMMGINIASVGDVAGLFSSTTTLATLDDDGYEYTNIITNPIRYVSERVENGIKVVRTLVAERIVAVESTFKRIFANELCLVDDETGNLVCVDAKTLRNINGAREVLIEDVLLPQISEEIIPTEDPTPLNNPEEVNQTEVVETVPEPALEPIQDLTPSTNSTSSQQASSEQASSPQAESETVAEPALELAPVTEAVPVE